MQAQATATSGWPGTAELARKIAVLIRWLSDGRLPAEAPQMDAERLLDVQGDRKHDRTKSGDVLDRLPIGSSQRSVDDIAVERARQDVRRGVSAAGRLWIVIDEGE